MSFDSDAFLDWLNGQDGAIEAQTLTEEWPDFPTDQLCGCTGPMIDGDFYYYQHDLRRIAEGRGIID